MKTFERFEELVYGDRSLVLTKTRLAKSNLVSPMRVAKFLITLNELDYAVQNAEDLFSVSEADFEALQEHIVQFLSGFDIDGFMFRTSFANTLELSEYTAAEWKAMFAQYSITYGWASWFKGVFREDAQEVISDFFSGEKEKAFEMKTKSRFIKISFDYEGDVKSIIKSILESKTVLREQQIETVKAADLSIVADIFRTANISIKDIEVLVIQMLLEGEGEIDVSLFKNMDLIARTVAYSYSFKKEDYAAGKKFVKFTNDQNKQLNKTMLKELFIKMPTRSKKAFVKAIDSKKDINAVVEEMFKYYGFWKKIFTALRFESSVKMAHKYPTFQAIKDKLYVNDRSGTLNARVEKAKSEGDYLKAVRELSANPGALMRNIFEYIRYEEGMTKAKKTKKPGTRAYQSPEASVPMGTIDFEAFFSEGHKSGLETEKKKNETTYSKKIKTDAMKFFKSEEFTDALAGKNGKMNTKLLWHAISLFEDENLYRTRTERFINATKTGVEYERPLPGMKKKRAENVKKQLKTAIKKIKRTENESLGSVYIDKALKNHNVEFSGRAANGITLSGEHLTPGSKIPFKDLLGKDKILRLGIAWRGEKSCDIDHSLSIFGNDESSIDQREVYYGDPTLSIGGDVLITSSGDVTTNGNKLFSVELIDIDIDKAIEHGLGNMVSSAIQFSGLSFDNYEILWFMNIIDRKDRVMDSRRMSIPLDQMDYAIQVNEASKHMLGFYINLEKGHLEVLNISTSESLRSNYSNAKSQREAFEKMLANRPPLLAINKVLKSVIRKEQIVADPEDADVVFVASDKNLNLDKKIKVITPGKDGEELKRVIF